MHDDFLRPSHFPLLETLLFHQNLPMRGTFTVAEVVELFGVCVRTIQLRVKRGQLHARALPGRGRFLATDLEEFLRTSAVPGGADVAEYPNYRDQHCETGAFVEGTRTDSPLVRGKEFSI